MAYIIIRVKLDKSNENSIFECEILQMDGFLEKFIRRTYHTIWDRNRNRVFAFCEVLGQCNEINLENRKFL